jgi:thioredoxin 1
LLKLEYLNKIFKYRLKEMATEITQLIEIPPNKKVIIDFYATWCGPCARVTPIIDELADKFQDIVFLKVNVDDADEIAAGFEISQLPTFVYLNMGNIFQRIEGANLSDILGYIEKLDRVVNKEPEIRNKKEVEDSEVAIPKESRKETRKEPVKDARKETKREETKREETKREEPKRVESKREEPKREETKDERNLRKKLEARVQIESEAMPQKKIDMKISKSKETEKKKSKKQSSKESQKKAERRNFNDVNPYEIEYNNDTPKISSDDSDDSNSDDSGSDNSDKISSIGSISS